MELIGLERHSADGVEYLIATLWTGSEWRVVIYDKDMQDVEPLFSATLMLDEPGDRKRALKALADVARREIDSGRVKSKASPDKA